jgi:DNA-directed RNA polymerase subunit omega
VVLAARRARQINSYYQSLNEGGYGDYPPPMVPAEPGKGALTLALEEVATGKLKYEYRS